MGPLAEDRRIRALRPPKRPVDPWQPLGTLVEEERRPGGLRERALTVFLAGSECPFTCSFCDLWRATLDRATPLGALPRQLALALQGRDPLALDRLKLYNASNFFDRRAVPPGDLEALAQLAAPFRAVTVESHARTIDRRARDFAARLSGRLEVAIGLETIEPVAMAHLNKRMDLADFDRAARFLQDSGVDLRVFVLLGVPYTPPGDAVDWCVRSVEYALARGAGLVALIPVRGGNGELERLESAGHFVRPTLAQLEEALERSLDLGAGVVTADLWDVERLIACPACGPARVARLRRLNATGVRESPVICAACGPN
jgi:radical SAM enzyme (TIGR01210 family)